MGFAGVFMGFAGFCWVLLGIDWALMGFAGSWLSFAGFRWVLTDFAGFVIKVNSRLRGDYGGLLVPV